MRFKYFIRLLYLTMFTLFPVILFGQYYNLGQDPSFLKWRQIISPHFRVIYPENFETKAVAMMAKFDSVYKYGTSTLAFKPKRIPFIIHNYTIVPNAVTVWTPKRVEIFTCPPQDSYAENWLDQLIVHEYRHVVQIDRNNQGFTKGLSWLLGEQAAPIINGLFVPSWFMEGDAVCTETALSQSGRGRIPVFEMLLRTQVMQDGANTYDKAAFGSYVSFVPNQYNLGYSLVANVRRRYGYQTWITALDEVARKPFILTPFNHGLKKATGFGKEDLYRQTMLDMDSMWKIQDLKTQKTRFTQLTSLNQGKYTNYKFPFYLTDTMVISEFSSLDDITRFVITDRRGRSVPLVTPGFLSSESYSVCNRNSANYLIDKNRKLENTDQILLAWTETINDPRWQQRSYSEIMIYDGSTGKIRKLTPKSRYFAPSFSPDGKLLAAVTMDQLSHCSIVLINSVTGLEEATLVSTDDDFFMTPAWSEDGTKLVFTRLDENGKSINMFDINKQALTILVSPTFTEISNPVFAETFVLFNGSYSGIENVYAVDINTKQILQVTSSEFGACNADLSPDGRKMVYSNYSSGGYSLVETDVNPEAWKHLNAIQDFSPSLYKSLVEEETMSVNTAYDTLLKYESESYKKAAHIFRFHSWAPAYINYMAGENGTGISFMSQNDLSTATTVIGYSYDMAENTGKVTADFSWQGWYPVIDFNTSYGARAVYSGGDSSFRYTFNETIFGGGFSLPLVFTGGKYYKGLQLGVHTSLNNITDNTYPLDEEDKLTGTIHSLDYSFSVYRLIKQSGKDLYPRWGQVINGRFRHSPFGDNDLGSIASAGVRLYFPGIIKHHGVRIDINLQERKPGRYTYSNQINLPRGYYMLSANTLACFALNYKFPFAYPDMALGPLVYFKRFKANLFYDGGVADNQKLQSTGVEITSDLHVLRFIFPMDIGFRFGFLPVEKQYFTDFLFSVNL